MTAINDMLQELEQETQTTRRVLERVPDDQLEWRPHPKSLTLGQLALHIALIPGRIAELAMQSPATAAPIPRPQPDNMSAVLTTLDQSVAKAKAILGPLPDAALASTWRMVAGDREIMAMPRGALLRAIMLNHWYHHRGQLTVYLRQVGALVPAVYGPSADENPAL